ncbi:MAG: DUF192 domain-containing protein [Candidatus Saccharimonadales bacterium]
MKKLLIVIGILVVLGGTYWLYTNRTDPTIATMPKVTATINESKFTLYAPDTPEGMQKGLAIFKVLPENEGMIFRGLPVGTQTFWMKDMNFDIDIIWVNKDNKVIHIVYDASKESYPARFENPIELPSSYVIELNAGLAEKHGIAPGTLVSIN